MGLFGWPAPLQNWVLILSLMYTCLAATGTCAIELSKRRLNLAASSIGFGKIRLSVLPQKRASGITHEYRGQSSVRDREVGPLLRYSSYSCCVAVRRHLPVQRPGRPICRVEKVPAEPGTASYWDSNWLAMRLIAGRQSLLCEQRTSWHIWISIGTIPLSGLAVILLLLRR